MGAEPGMYRAKLANTTSGDAIEAPRFTSPSETIVLKEYFYRIPAFQGENLHYLRHLSVNISLRPSNVYMRQ